MNDPLTGLIGRWQFLDILRDNAGKADKQNINLALLVVEIKNFQRINLLHQHTTGDRVLQYFADVLRQVGRENDIISRIGDRKFALLLNGIGSIEHAKLAAYKIHRLLETTFQFELTEIRCAATVGIALSTDNAIDPESLLQKAELALNQAKLSNQSIGVADSPGNDTALNELDLEVELIPALEDFQLKVFFQPKISVTTGLPSGAEALVRWQHPVHGLLGPDKFLPIAESAGFLKPITQWVLNTALRLSNRWTDKWGNLKLSVNIPTISLEQADFIDIVQSARDLWQKKDITLCLEILENSFISNTSSTFKTLKELQALGVKISIDDFGTGYSSLSYFRDIPADELKIDQSFILGLRNDQANLKIISLIVDLAHSFGLSVVAEGVENAEIVAALKQFQCDEFQGYYYSRPIPAEEFLIWLDNFQPDNELIS
ncbi:MAG: bifunctional diguanylate cyclase/phosphodiesterase [Gammaproteobacteria bacterium]|nr:bifunctional diguanylate cyclase/phosphodiesterase [Gammaproteobacteria bacterium]